MDIHVFRAGGYIDMSGTPVTLTERDVAACAAAYDPGLSEAPIVVGHPATNAPAYGWVQSLAANGGDLTAKAGQVNVDFAELVRNGSFKKVSAASSVQAHDRTPFPAVTISAMSAFWERRHPPSRDCGPPSSRTAPKAW